MLHVNTRVISRIAASVAGAAFVASMAASASPSLVSATEQAPASARTPMDVTKRGPQVGEQVPDFNLPDQSGQVWTRQSIMGPKGAMLVFVRSADW